MNSKKKCKDKIFKDSNQLRMENWKLEIENKIEKTWIKGRWQKLRFDIRIGEFLIKSRDVGKILVEITSQLFWIKKCFDPFKRFINTN